MIADVREAAMRSTGLALRLLKCTWSRVQRQEQDMACLRPAESHTTIGKLQELPKGDCAHILGASVQFDGQHTTEFRTAVRAGWAAFHSKKAL